MTRNNYDGCLIVFNLNNSFNPICWISDIQSSDSINSYLKMNNLLIIGSSNGQINIYNKYNQFIPILNIQNVPCYKFVFLSDDDCLAGLDTKKK